MALTTGRRLRNKAPRLRFQMTTRDQAFGNRCGDPCWMFQANFKRSLLDQIRVQHKRPNMRKARARVPSTQHRTGRFWRAAKLISALEQIMLSHAAIETPARPPATEPISIRAYRGEQENAFWTAICTGCINKNEVKHTVYRRLLKVDDGTPDLPPPLPLVAVQVIACQHQGRSTATSKQSSTISSGLHRLRKAWSARDALEFLLL